ncbi:MAG: CPBP family intramembrane glutamic endopeptidase [Hyphomicrobium sp.]
MTVVSARLAASGQLFSGPPRYVPSTPWGPFGALAATLLIFAGQMFGVAVVVAVYAFQHGAGKTAADFDPETLFSLATPAGLATMIGSQLASILIVWLLAGRKGRRADALQMNPPPASLGTCLQGGLIIVTVTGILEYGLYKTLDENLFADTKFLAEGLGSPLWMGTMLMAVVLAPLWEELTFRGFLLSALAQTRLGFWGAALICNVLWTALHAQYGAAGIASVFVSGLILSWLLWRTGSIRAPVIAHGIANLFAAGFAYLFNPALQSVAT